MKKEVHTWRWYCDTCRDISETITTGDGSGFPPFGWYIYRYCGANPGGGWRSPYRQVSRDLCGDCHSQKRRPELEEWNQHLELESIWVVGNSGKLEPVEL